MLHIIKTQSSIHSALNYVQTGDVILLMEEAVYLANSRHHLHALLAEKAVYVLIPDINARGLQSVIADNLLQVDYPGFVELSEQHSSSLTWE